MIISSSAPVTWIREPEDIRISLGSPVDINCQAEGVPPPIVVLSRKTSSTSLELSRGIKRANHELKSITNQDSGSYSCEATSHVGHLIKDFLVVVQGQSFNWMSRDWLIVFLEKCFRIGSHYIAIKYSYGSYYSFFPFFDGKRSRPKS